MHVSEEQRRALHDRLREHLDEETADLVLEVTVPANMELATRPDLLELRAEILLRLGVRIDELDARLSARIDELDTRLSTRIDELDARLSARIDSLSARIDELDARLSARIDSLSARIDGLNARVDGLSTRIEELSKQVAGVEKAIDDLGALLSRQLMTRVLPLMVAALGVFIGLATWLG